MTTTDDTADLPGIYAHGLLEVVADWAVPPERLLAGLGLTEARLRDPDTRVSIADCETIFARAVEACGEPGLAFFLGLRMRLSAHGFLGFAAMTAPTLGAALELAERYSMVRTTAVEIRHRVEGGRASVELPVRVPLGTLHEPFVVTLFVFLNELVRALSGRRPEATVHFTFPQPDHFARFTDFAPGAILFDRPVDGLHFDAELLSWPIVSADPAATTLAQAQCERELAALLDGDSFSSRVRAAATLERGFRGLPEVASELHVSPRTLKRRLADRGESFKGLIDELRLERARALLADPDLPLVEVAERVGYSDPTNFSRAFKRWTGRTPAAERRERR